jgi:Protein of unknown function (DUF1350)
MMKQLRPTVIVLATAVFSVLIVPPCFSFSLQGPAPSFVVRINHNQYLPSKIPDEKYHLKQTQLQLNQKKRPSATTTCVNSSTNFDAVGDLTSALARIDRQWQIQQRKSGVKSRWKKLQLLSPTAATTTSTKIDDQQQEQQQDKPSIPFGDSINPVVDDEYVYLLEPPYNSIPSCIIVFTGGAGLGTYPQIAYNELLLRLSNRLNAVVITPPYQVGLDHFTLAKETGDKMRRAIIQCQDDSSRMFSPTIPVYSLSHSLGSKLSAIYVSATGLQYDGMGFMAFNNFGFGQTIGMAGDFAKMIRNGSDNTNPPFGKSNVAGVSEEMINNFFSFAETAVSAIGLEFVPKPSDMERLLLTKFTPDWLRKVRLFTFDDDQLDSTQRFINSVQSDVSVSGLPGTHLAPVYFKVSFDDDIFTDGINFPPEAKEIAKEAMGGLESASFGNEVELEGLIEEVCNWIKGKDVSRKPSWLRERPKLSGTSTQ